MLSHYPPSHRGLGVRLAWPRPKVRSNMLTTYTHRWLTHDPRGTLVPFRQRPLRKAKWSPMGCVPVSLDSLVRPVTAVPLLLASRLLRPLAQWRPHPSISYVLTLVPEVLTSFVFAGPLIRSQPAGKVLPPR